MEIDEAVLREARVLLGDDDQKLNELVEDFLRSLEASTSERAALVDRMAERLRGKIQIDVPDDYRSFIRSQRFDDMRGTQRPGA